MHSHRLPWSAAVAALAVTLISVPAEAQLGGLVRRAVGDKVAEKAMGKVESRTAAPAFNDRVLEITDARVDQLLKGLAAERALRAREAQEEGARAAARRKYDAEHAEWERQMAVIQPKQDEYSRCVMRAGVAAMTTQQDPVIRRANEAIMAMPAAERDRFQERMEGLSERWEAAKARGDKAAAAELEETMGKEYEQVTGISRAEMQRAVEKTRASTANGVQGCGEAPTVPPEPRDPYEESASEEAGEVGASASGLNAEQYAVLRERVIAFLQSRGDQRNDSYVFSADEQRVLGARQGELQSYQQLLLGEEG